MSSRLDELHSIDSRSVERGGAAAEESGEASGIGRVKEMPFLEHLEELRRVIIDSLWGVIAGSAVGWFFSGQMLAFLIRPAGSLVFLGPADALNLRIKIALFAGLMLASPLILYKLWSFIGPGLLPLERRVVGPLVMASTTLLVTGVVFAHQVLAPVTFKFLLSFQSENLQPFLTADAYFGFLAKLCIAFGFFFQLPIVVGVLTGSGVVPSRFFVRRWREAVVLVLVAAALFTPPDVVSQVIMAGPIMLLYGISTAVAVVFERRRAKRRAADAAREQSDDAGS